MRETAIPSLILTELREIEEKGLKWGTIAGSRHWKLTINDKVVAVLPKQSKTKQEANKRTVLNVRATIRRYVQALLETPAGAIS